MMPLLSSGCAASENALGGPSVAGRARYDGIDRRDAAGSEWQVAINVNPDPDQVRDALAQLPDRHRAMIDRAYYLRRTTTQIAVEFGTDDQVVKDELHHALHGLRTCLQSRGARLLR